MFIDYTREPRRAIFFEDVKSNYASIECVERGLHPLETSLCVMSRSDHSYGLILASSPKFKEVFGKSNVSRAADLPFLLENRKFNYRRWYSKHTDIYGQRTEPSMQHVAFIESWAKRTHIVPPQMALYIDKNIEMQQLLANYTSSEEIHSYSIDESFLDVTESLNLFYPKVKDKYEQMDLLARDLQKKVLDQMGLYVTVGMGDNPLLAKLAMDNYAKHSTTMRALIRYEDVPEKVWTLSKMTDFWGIGRRTEKRFNKLGIYSIKDLAHANPDRIKRKMGVVGLQQFFHAHGIDETNVREKHHKKSESYSNSQILPRDYVQQDEIELVIKEMAEHLAIRLRKGKKLAGGLFLYVKPSYKEYSSSIKISSKIEPTQSTTDIQVEFLRLFRKKYRDEVVREIGIGGFDLSSENIKQLNLFETMLSHEPKIIAHQKQEALQNAIDEIRDKFDFTAIQKASILTAGSRVLERNKMIGGHAAAGGEKNDS
ncbi:Y-family DNA polymerase [Lactococcus formosensis]|jgi:DNA polymerase V|uniref:Y-family DNA polymerase n=1 Tax=Lactococcus formosensis TaxID=1281486 RepID=A0A9Q9D5U1_9LACT|nr:Y-family DNA polymerase [Lactococcus formosensis]NHJ00398.1 Y-family DNA polymerase [Lactococcus garvieae]MCO7180040.1 Y-family DNA polymerase [Lactococcus formosensis]MDG6110927.1 Y-family DNA polymerase [Lactococcus formosensis]MDG6117465.1 Y-family DNA polymerase [Lactococcus formosensis]MDG6153941.1 Y-family DNA polymerase [Lactococcus formosensis]